MKIRKIAAAPSAMERTTRRCRRHDGICPVNLVLQNGPCGASREAGAFQPVKVRHALVSPKLSCRLNLQSGKERPRGFQQLLGSRDQSSCGLRPVDFRCRTRFNGPYEIVACLRSVALRAGFLTKAEYPLNKFRDCFAQGKKAEEHEGPQLSENFPIYPHRVFAMGKNHVAEIVNVPQAERAT
jgi:hypothetical protein